MRRPSSADPHRLKKSRQLARAFEDFNARFFDNRLPRYRVVFKPLRVGLAGRCNVKSRTIVITPRAGEERGETLLHEMVHIAAGPSHGLHFHREIERLLEMKAPIVPHLSYYPPWLDALPRCRAWVEQQGITAQTKAFAHFFYTTFEDAGTDGVTNFAAAARYIASQEGRTVAELFRRISRQKALECFRVGRGFFLRRRARAGNPKLHACSPSRHPRGRAARP